MNLTSQSLVSAADTSIDISVVWRSQKESSTKSINIGNAAEMTVTIH